MKPGFTLIELSIGILLSGIIATVLYNSFFITHRIVDIADNFIQTDFRAAIISNQFEKDLDGALIPIQPDLTKTATPAKTTTQPAAKEAAQAPPPKPIEHIFYSTNNAEGSLEMLTFLTNNPVKIYEKAKNAKAKPRFVRVVYRLIPQQVPQQGKEQKSYTLLRQESNELELKAFDLKSAKPIRAYELATNIKNMKIEYSFPVQKEQAQQPAKAPTPPTIATPEKKESKEEKPKPEFKTVYSWDVESQKAPKEQPKTPQFVTVSLELWNNQQQQEKSFTFNYEIPTFLALMQPAQAQKATPAPAPTPAPTPSTPAAQATPTPSAAKT